jgi:hypothetical protein
MFIEANDVLEGLPTGLTISPEVLHARLRLLIEMRSLEKARC